MELNRKFRMAFIGAGSRANQVHYPAFASLEDVEIVGICDIDAERLKATADRYGVPESGRYGENIYSYRDMLQELKPDGVAVIGQPHIMFDIWVWVLEHGFNLYIEKPMGLTLHEARLLDFLAKKNNVVGAVSLQRRTTPVAMQLRERCLQRGDITHALVRFYKCDQKPYINARDHMMDDTVHAIDTLRWIFGDRKVVKIESKCRAVGTPDINYISATLEFEGGGMGYILNSWSSGRRIFDIEMHAPGCCAEVEHEKGGAFYADGDTEGEYLSSQDAAGNDSYPAYTGVVNLARNFVDCCRDRNIVPCGAFPNALETMRIAEKILAQAVLEQ